MRVVIRPCEEKASVETGGAIFYTRDSLERHVEALRAAAQIIWPREPMDLEDYLKEGAKKKK